MCSSKGEANTNKTITLKWVMEQGGDKSNSTCYGISLQHLIVFPSHY